MTGTHKTVQVFVYSPEMYGEYLHHTLDEQTL